MKLNLSLGQEITAFKIISQSEKNRVKDAYVMSYYYNQKYDKSA